MDDDADGWPIRAPHWWHRAGEGRAAMELSAFVASAPMLRLLGRGDRHPVMVLPGFTATDYSTRPLRWVLRSQGYWTHGWSLGRNLGPTPAVVHGLHRRLAEIHTRHGHPVSLIGWSLGGVYARAMARASPDAVRQVITLGSPFRMQPGDRSSVAGVSDRLERHWDLDAMQLAADEASRAPLSMPSTAVYTRSDGVVRWHRCIDRVDSLHENIEVTGSHSGLGVNPAVIYAISDRLAQPADDWRPFSPPLAMRRLYPRPADFVDRDTIVRSTTLRRRAS